MKNIPLWIYNTLRTHYGDLGWWPGEPYEIMVGAVLVQNTAWGNVVKSIANFEGRLTPEHLETMPTEALVEAIYPSGFYTAKAACLGRVTAWYKQYGYAVEAVQRQPLARLRGELLALKGIGQETADAILLYAFHFPTFVIDAYTTRLAERLALPVVYRYQPMQTYFQAGLQRDAALYGDYHILLLEHGKTHCRKKPVCNGCPLCARCDSAKRTDDRAAAPAGCGEPPC